MKRSLTWLKGCFPVCLQRLSSGSTADNSPWRATKCSVGNLHKLPNRTFTQPVYRIYQLDSRGGWTGDGNRCLAESFRDEGMNVSIDAVVGTGFYVFPGRTFRERMQRPYKSYSTWYPYTGFILLGSFIDIRPGKFCRTDIVEAVGKTLSVANAL